MQDEMNDLQYTKPEDPDIVKVVRCGSCKHMTPDGRCLEFADDCLRPSASDYCSYGEAKSDL